MAMTGRRFVADDANPGRREEDWAASPALAGIPELVVPSCQHVVVVAPHPDDEVLGAGGLLQVLAGAGASIEVCAVTDGEGSHPGAAKPDLGVIRTAESTAALGRLGLAGIPRARLGLPDGEVAAHREAVATFLSSRLGPRSLCVAPWAGDGHPDHDSVGQAAAEAAAATGAALLEYLVWAWHWADPVGFDLPWAACRRLRLDRRQRARKRWATGAFRSQVGPFGPPHSETTILPAAVLRRFWRPFEVFVA